MVKNKNNDKALKVANKISELPEGYAINESFMGIKKEDKVNVIVYFPIGHQNNISERFNKRVWVLGTKSYFDVSSIAYFELRKNLSKNKYDIGAQVVTTDAVIKTLYENMESNRTNISSEEPRGELQEYYEDMVTYALREKVSDIHIEKRSTRSVIRMRKHGQLMAYSELSNSKADRLSRVIYNVLAENQDVSFREDIYQAASVNTNISGEAVKLRFQSLPVYPGGFDVVLRVLPIGSDGEAFTPLENFGYSLNQKQSFLEIASKPVGVTIISGTTGSGKSTTLKSLLMFINNARQFHCKIFTIEDPPEYKIPRVSQIPVVRRDDDDEHLSPFLEPLKAVMRGDPDIIMIGEIRDEFTGDGLKKATQSGHQVFTTIHATSALGIVERLSDFGIPASVMGSPEFIKGLVYQKLLPVICPHCAIDFNELIQSSNATEKDIELLKRIEKVADLNKHSIKVRGDGCDKCNHMGIIGRTVCAEIISPDYTMLNLFRESRAMEAKYHWRSLSDHDTESDNMTGKTILEHALFKMREGKLCPFDIELLLGPLDSAINEWEEMENQHYSNNSNNNGNINFE